MLPMTLDPSQLPDDIAILKAMVIAGGREIEALKLTIAKLRRDKFGASSERGAKLLDQLELQLAELRGERGAGYSDSQDQRAGRTEQGQAAAQARPPATACAFATRARGAFRPRRHARAAAGP